MADETLRMQAEVVDRFSGPLKALRAHLLDAGREGAAHGEILAKGVGKAEAALQTTAKTAQTVLNPALAALGVTGLGAGVAVAGIASALNGLTGNLSTLGQLSRETGMAADQLRIFQSVAGKFGISSDASAAAAKTFSENMRDIRRGVGDVSGFLQSQNPIIAQYYQRLRGTKDNDQANKIAEEMLEHVPNAIDRGRLAARIYGNSDLGRLGDQHLGPISGLNKKAEEKLGPLPEGAVESAERYERAIGNLRSSMQKVGTTIALELIGPAERFTSWIEDIVSDKRKAGIDALRNGMREIGAELGKVDWKGAGESVKDLLVSTTSLVGTLAKGLKDVVDTVRYLRQGEYMQALRGADGASGSLARKLAPRVGDDEIDARENVERLTKLRDVAKEASEHLIGRTQQRMGLLDSPEAAQQKLTAAEAELKRLQARTPEQRQKDFEATDKLRRSIDSLTDEMKAKRGDATAQKSSAEGDGPFGGARIQSAAFGGGGFRRLPGLGIGSNLPSDDDGRIHGGPSGAPGAGSGPSYSGEQGERNAMRERFREHLKRTVPGYDGGDTVPIGPGGRVAPMPEPPAIADTSGRTYKGISARDMRDVNPEMADYIRRSAIAHGIDPNVALRIANSEGLRGSIPGVRNTPGDKGTSFGPFQLHYGSKIPGLTLKGLGDRYTRETGHHASDPKYWQEQIDFALRTARKEGWGAWHGRIGAGIGLRDGIGTVRPQPMTKPGDGSRAPSLADGDYLSNGAPRVLRPNSMKDAPGVTMDEANRARSGQADGEGWAAREKARKEFEAKIQQGEGRLDRSAGRAGVLGGQKLEANGSVSVVVQKPGPDTQVRTSTAGNLFKDVVLRRGRPMASTDGT